MTDSNANNSNQKQQSKTNTVVLAYSGGLDTSFCIPWLIDKGYVVVTVFVDSGGVSDEEKIAIAKRAKELGAIEHREVDISDKLWQQVIVPLIWSGEWYQGQYPLLCSDRYLIVSACLTICDELGTKIFAHGCTGMGNDQVRFDLTVNSLGDYQIIAPIREIQAKTDKVRAFEIDYLKDKGFSPSDKVNRYSVNENLLGATISGSEIDLWQQPAEDSFILCKPHSKRQNATKNLRIHFNSGVVDQITYDDKILSPKGMGSAKKLLQTLNQLAGSYGVGRDIYTGDTTIGIKGRIVFEAPALKLMAVAHKALEQTILSKAQQRSKRNIANEWTLLVYEGLYFDPLKTDLESYLQSNQKFVSGWVELQLTAGEVVPVAIESDNILSAKDSVYAQSCDWTSEQASGFIKLFGQSSVLASLRNSVIQ